MIHIGNSKMAPVLALLVILTLMVLITRLATIALTLTGISRETAAFQALSAFTGVGFTTAESEKVVNHPVRRRILLLLVVGGNAGVVTAVSSLILTFIRSDGSGNLMEKVGFLFAGLLLLFLIAASRWADKLLSRIVRGLLKRYTHLDVQDYAALLQLAGEYQVAELYIEPEDWLAGKTLIEAMLHQEGILVLGIHRRDGTYRGIPKADTGINAGDTLIIYARESAVAMLDERQGGKLGDIEHFDAILEEKRIEEEERQQDVEESDPQPSPPETAEKPKS